MALVARCLLDVLVHPLLASAADALYIWIIWCAAVVFACYWQVAELIAEEGAYQRTRVVLAQTAVGCTYAVCPYIAISCLKPGLPCRTAAVVVGIAEDA